MDKEEKINIDDVFNYDEEEEQEEDQTPENMEEILEKNIEERNKSNIKDKEIISKFNKDNLKSTDKVENIIEQPDFVEQTLLENQNSKTIKEIKEEEKINKEKEKEDEKLIKIGKNKIKISPNKYRISLPDEFTTQNVSPFDFIDFMERKYNKHVLEKERDKYFYLEKYVKNGKFPEIKCYKFVQKNSIMNHILKTEKNYTKNKTITKITCLVANDDLIYIGDNNGIIKIFSLNSEIEIGPLNSKPDDNIDESEKGENKSVTSMDILSNKNLLACGYYNGVVEVWDLKNKVCRKKLEKSLTEHKGQILAVKFLNGNNKTMELITSDSAGLVNIVYLTEKILTFKKNAEFNAEVNPLIDYSQPIFVVETLKFTEEEKKMPFLKNNIEIVGFACYDYVLIYQLNPNLIELYKFPRPSYFKDFHMANISFGLGYLPRTKDIIDINRDQNQRLNEKASENCLDSKNTNRLIAVSWDIFINIYAIKYDREKGVEAVAIIGNYIHSCEINRMLFVSDSTIFIYDKKGKFKLLNTGLFSPGEINFEGKKDSPIYDKSKEKRALIQEMKNVTDKVLKQNYIPQSNKKDKNVTTESYYNSIYANDSNLYILGKNNLELGKIYSWEECIDRLKNDFEWINAFVFGVKLFKGEREFIPFPEVPIDTKKRKEAIKDKMSGLIKEYIIDRFKVDKSQINEAKYNKILTESIFLSIEFCFGIESCDFLFKELLPIYTKKNLEKFFFENLEPYIINGELGDQIFEEPILKKLILLYTERKEYQRVGQIIKNLYLSVGNSETVANRTTKYDTIFTGLITFCSTEKNEDYMFPARQIYEYFQKAKEIPYELYLKEKFIDEKKEKKMFYFDYENIVNNIDIDELILSYQYLGSMLLWYIKLCYEGYKFPSGKLIEDKKYIELIQQLFLWLINDEVLTRFIEFDCYSIFSIFKKIFMKKLKILEKIEYSDLFKLIKIGNKELNEANVQKYFEIIYRKALTIDKGKNIYVNDDLYDFICSVATIIPLKTKEEEDSNNILIQALMQALNYVINYEENMKNIEKFENDLLSKKIENYKQNLELKEKYDRYCMHLNKYKDKTYLLYLSNTIMAAIENNSNIFTTKNLEDILRRTEKTELTKVKIYLAKKIKNFGKCLDIYLKEFKGEEQTILTYNFILSELDDVKDDKIEYPKKKEEILTRITEISSLSIERLIELTEKYFDSNYAGILFKINNNANKLKYLEQIIDKYKEEELNPNEPATIEYEKILKLQIDLLCNLKYYDQVLPNLQKRNLYPINYCIEKCREHKIYDAWIYLDRKSGNISEAINLVNLLTKENFNKLKLLFRDNYQIIKQNEKNEKSKEDEDINDINDILEAEEEMRKGNLKEEEEIIYKNKLFIRNQDKILKQGVEICETSTQTASSKASKEDSKKHWKSLISNYYELIKEIKSDIVKKEITKEIGDDLIKIIDDKAGEITEKMYSFFDLNSILKLISQIQGESFGTKEYKSLLKRLLFSGEAVNRILKAADSILKDNVLDYNIYFKKDAILGKQYNFERCDFCGKIFKENDKNSVFAFNCGHKCHFDCCAIINQKVSCQTCKDYDNKIEEKEPEINEIKEKGTGKRAKDQYRKSSIIINDTKADREKKEKMKTLNKINDNYYELYKMFQGN